MTDSQLTANRVMSTDNLSWQGGTTKPVNLTSVPKAHMVEKLTFMYAHWYIPTIQYIIQF